LHANLAAISLFGTDVPGGQQVLGTVTLDNEAPAGGAVITLTSDQPVAMLPSTVTAPAGSFGAAFQMRTIPVAQTVTARITATYAGVSRSAAVQIDAPAVIRLQANPSTLTGGAPSTGTVSISSAAPAGGLPVGLVSGDPARVTVPAQVVVPEGATSASFPIATRPVTAPALVPIRTTAGQGLPALLRLLPVGLTLAPDSVRGGLGTTGTVTLPAPAPAGGTRVTLSSGNPAVRGCRRA